MSTTQLPMLKQRMDALGLDFMSAGFDSWIADQSRKDLPLLDAVSSLLETEYVPRKERQIRTRIKISGLPQHKLLSDFDLSWPKGGLTKRKFEELSTLAFVARKENLVLMGPSGLGKTHLMLGLGYKACLEGYSVYHISCTDLIESLHRARKAGTLARRLKWLKKCHLLLIDEVGYENLCPENANLLFQVVNTRYEKGSLVMTTNRPFGQWGELMHDDAIATATLDRLLHHAHVIALEGDSYRMKNRLKTGLKEF